MRRFLTFFVLLIALAATLVYGAMRWVDQQFATPSALSSPISLRVQQGSSVRSVLMELQARGALKSAKLTEVYLRIHNRRVNIKAGEYAIPPNASPADIAKLLEEGKVVLFQLTVVEGSTFAEMRKALERHPKIIAKLKGKSNADVMIAIGHGGEHPEGRFFPDTYRFASETTDVDLLKLSYGQMAQTLKAAWEQRAPDLPLRSPYEALILASIIEKETGQPAERPRISGVFIERLRKGMRLQTDPTVIYGIGAKYDGDIRSKDLVTDTPYNTYTRAGLPPTPIALPGKESVFAAVKPEDTGDIFFVATGDGSGAHFFSKTLEEHNAAVARYLARIKARNATPAPVQQPEKRAPSSNTATPAAQGANGNSTSASSAARANSAANNTGAPGSSRQSADAAPPVSQPTANDKAAQK